MQKFLVPTKDEVSAENQVIFENLKKGLGFVPNLYAYFAKNETALGDYLAFQGRKSTLKVKEKEVINLVTSQLNNCHYCQSAHTAIGKMNGFTDEEIIEIRLAAITFDARLDALAQFTKSVVLNKGKVAQESKELFFQAGFSEANMIDVVFVVGDKIISNYIHNLAGFPVDFPLASVL